MKACFRKGIARLQSGFTLVELVIVVAVIGILIALVAPTVSQSRDGAVAKQLAQVAQQSVNGWGLLNSTAGTTTDVSAGHPLYGTGKDVHDILFNGRSNVATSFQKYWDSAGVLALTNSVVADSACTGKYRVSNFCVQITGTGGAFNVAYSSVPSRLALKVAQQVDPTATLSGTAALTVGEITLSAETAGVRTVTFAKSL